ncbi:MAG: YhdH/YhfP family quinone oxidoreductase [Bacteroidota bacterium]
MPDFPAKKYRALVADKDKSGKMSLSIRRLNTRDLPEHTVLVRVHYSSLNYKDALSASGDTGVTKHFPHTPGIDAAGVVEHSRDPGFHKGDEVIVTSYDLGQNTPGGFGEYISVPGSWIVPLPHGLSLEESMTLGTAGFTAAYGIKKITDAGIDSGTGAVLVTGATGGVGSLAVSIFAKLGFDVIAATGKKERHEYLKKLGAAECISRDSVTNVKHSPLLSSRWVAAIDTVGGEMLDCVIRQTSHNGVVACCGNILGGDLETSVYPFILRGISLMGIDSGNCLMDERKTIWKLLADEWKPDNLELLSHRKRLDQLPSELEKILTGGQTGRVLVSLRD